jgi:hypothetical protein
MSNEQKTTEKNKTKKQPKVTEVELDVKVKNHPDDLKYPNTKCKEHSEAEMTFLVSLTNEQLTKYQNDELVVNEDETKKFIESVQVDDYIGIFYTFGKVTSKTNDSITLLVSKKYISTFSLNEIDNAREMKFCQILYRDEKPFGIAETQKVKVKFIDNSTKSKKTTSKKTTSKKTTKKKVTKTKKAK